MSLDPCAIAISARRLAEELVAEEATEYLQGMSDGLLCVAEGIEAMVGCSMAGAPL